MIENIKEIPEGIESDKLILVGDCLKKFKDKGIHVEDCQPDEPASHGRLWIGHPCPVMKWI